MFIENLIPKQNKNTAELLEVEKMEESKSWRVVLTFRKSGMK